MRSIFFRLLLSFSLTILLTGVISGLVMYSLSRRSVDSFRHDFHRQLQASIARSIVLMGQAAQVMRQHRGERAFNLYVEEIQASMRTRLYLRAGDTVVPVAPALPSELVRLADTAVAGDQPLIRDDGRELLVIQRLRAPDGASYAVIGLHRLGPPPGLDGPPPGRPDFFPDNGPGRPTQPLPEPPPHPPFFGRGQWLRLVVFLAVAGTICYLLARSFSAPLERLRRISRQIAGGDLSARVGASLGEAGNEIGDLARDFDHMAEQMEEMVNNQKRLLRDISHELRSPLARLNLALELARKRFQAEEEGNLDRIGRESERLNNLISQLLSLTRSEAFTIDANTPRVALAELVRDVAQDVDFETRHLGKGVVVGEVAEASVPGSPELLRQAIENIIRNGATSTRSGSRVEVCLFTRKNSSTTNAQAVIRVRDHGPGVPEDKLPHLIEPFFRVAEARDRNTGGTGLGLAIAHHAIRQHGGLLHFRNAPDQDGLIVDIRLPLDQASPPEQTAAQDATFS